VSEYGDYTATMPRWSPDERRLLPAVHGSLYTVATEGTAELDFLTKSGMAFPSASWSPTGDRIVYTRLGPSPYNVQTVLHVVYADGSRDTPLDQRPATDAMFSHSIRTQSGHAMARPFIASVWRMK
jgi:Tol biopolymer transport system component